MPVPRFPAGLRTALLACLLLFAVTAPVRAAAPTSPPAQATQPRHWSERLGGPGAGREPVPPPGKTAPSPAPHRKLRVATRVVSPFVVERNGQLGGFSIDLWRSIAVRLGVEEEFVVQENVSDLLDAVRTGKADLAIAAISITSEREKTFDFSQPIFESGLQILVRKRTGGGGAPALTALFSPALLQLLGLILLLVLVPAHIVWLVERRHKEGIIGTERYFPGIFHACWWAVSTLATQAETMPRSALGRIIAVIWMFAGVVFVAYFTATVTASLTVQRLQGNVRGPRDLPGKRVATIAGSTSAAYLEQQGIETQTFKEIEGAYRSLLAQRADAVVYDSPILLHYAANDGKGKVEVVGGVFRQESYGILMPRHSPYRKPINEALLRLREDGTYQQIFERWFEARLARHSPESAASLPSKSRHHGGTRPLRTANPSRRTTEEEEQPAANELVGNAVSPPCPSRIWERVPHSRSHLS